MGPRSVELFLKRTLIAEKETLLTIQELFSQPRVFRESKSPTATALRIDSATAGRMNSPRLSPARRGRRRRPHSLGVSGGNARLAELCCHRRNTIPRASDY